MAYLNVAYVSPNAMNDLVLWSITGATRTAAAVTPREGVTHSTSVAVAHRARTATGPKKHPASRAASPPAAPHPGCARAAATRTGVPPATDPRAGEMAAATRALDPLSRSPPSTYATRRSMETSIEPSSDVNARAGGISHATSAELTA